MSPLRVVLLTTFILGTFVRWGSADTPANCTYEDIRGAWIFSESERSGNSSIDCSTMGPVANTLRVELFFPNTAIDEYGRKGFWTIIYNQGFEVVLNYRKYFAFSAYEKKGENVTSFCDRTFPGWSHDVLGHNWACYTAKKVTSQAPKQHYIKTENVTDRVYKANEEFINSINSAQSSWRAKFYPQFENMPAANMLRLRGGKNSKIISIPPPAPAPHHVKTMANNLPASWDWRNVSGISYVSPVRAQGECGSCYAFSGAGMIEARLRIATNNSIQVVLSPQDVVSCSKYSQGCDGGFPYLIGGKYAQDFGMVEESCVPYEEEDTPCTGTEKECKRYFTADYKYVGGFYGGCNEEVMLLQLLSGGPLSVSFKVYDDFSYYEDGIYHHTELNDKFNPYEETNHAVLLVGYGQDEASQEKFWIVKNSWGEEWGENGYFRIRRGNDECGIESIAVETTPIP